ncbi:MAG: alpha-amylase family protein [Planctomycetota bacterium]
MGPNLMQLGTQIYINPDDDPATIRRHVRLLAEHGMTLCRLFFDWHRVEPRRGLWTFEQFDVALDAAADHGVGVVPTLFTVAPPGWMCRTVVDQADGALHDPDVRPLADDYLRRCVERYRGHPALHSWIPWNEPSVGEPDWNEPGVLPAFHAYLAEQYGDVASYNRVAYRQLDALDDWRPIVGCDGPMLSTHEQIDVIRFRRRTLLHRLRDDVALIRSIDDAHPIHVNPAGLADLNIDTAQDIFAEAEHVDFMGCSAHPVWHAARLPRERWPAAIGKTCALARDASRRACYFWVTEMQAGPAASSGFTFDGPTAADLRVWMAKALGRGAAANVFWCLNARDRGGEAGEWSLLDQRGEPSARLVEVRRFAERLCPHRALLDTLVPAKPTVRILRSEASNALAHALGKGVASLDNPRGRQRCADAVTGAFLLLDDLGIDAGFVGESALADDPIAALDGARVLVLADACALTDTLFDTLRRAAAHGVTVIADGMTGFADDNGFLQRDRWPVLGEVFGATVADFLPTREPFDLPGLGVAGLFNKISLAVDGGAGVGKWPHDDHAAIVRRDHDSGGAGLRIGTHLFQRYAYDPTPAARKLIATHLPEHAKPTVALDPPLRTLRLCDPATQTPSLLVVINPTSDPIECTTTANRPDGSGHVIAAHDFGLFTVDASDEHEVGLI